MRNIEDLSISIARSGILNNTGHKKHRQFVSNQLVRKQRMLNQGICQKHTKINDSCIRNRLEKISSINNIQYQKTPRLKQMKSSQKINMENSDIHKKVRIAEKLFYPIQKIQGRVGLSENQQKQTITEKQFQNWPRIVLNNTQQSKISLSNINLSENLTAEKPKTSFYGNLITKQQQSQDESNNPSEEKSIYQKLQKCPENKSKSIYPIKDQFVKKNSVSVFSPERPIRPYIECVTTNKSPDYGNMTTSLLFSYKQQKSPSFQNVNIKNNKKASEQFVPTHRIKKSSQNLSFKIQDTEKKKSSYVSFTEKQSPRKIFASNEQIKNHKIKIEERQVNNNYRDKYKYNLFSMLDATANNLVEQVPGSNGKYLICGPTQCIAGRPKHSNWGFAEMTLKNIMDKIKQHYGQIQMGNQENMKQLQQDEKKCPQSELLSKKIKQHYFQRRLSQ